MEFGHIERWEERSIVMLTIERQVMALHRLWLPDYPMWSEFPSIPVACKIFAGHVNRNPITRPAIARAFSWSEHAVEQALGPLLAENVIRLDGRCYLFNEGRANSQKILDQVGQIVGRQVASGRYILDLYEGQMRKYDPKWQENLESSLQFSQKSGFQLNGGRV